MFVSISSWCLSHFYCRFLSIIFYLLTSFPARDPYTLFPQRWGFPQVTAEILRENFHADLYSALPLFGISRMVKLMLQADVL